MLTRVCQGCGRPWFYLDKGFASQVAFRKLFKFPEHQTFCLYNKGSEKGEISRFIHFTKVTQIISFSWLCNISIINVSKFLYPSICRWVFKLLSSLVFVNIVAMSIKVLISNYKNQMSNKKI